MYINILKTSTVSTETSFLLTFRLEESDFPSFSSFPNRNVETIMGAIMTRSGCSSETKCTEKGRHIISALVVFPGLSILAANADVGAEIGWGSLDAVVTF